MNMKSKSTSELKASIHRVEEICKSNKLGFTEIRRQVFEIIVKNKTGKNTETPGGILPVLPSERNTKLKLHFFTAEEVQQEEEVGQYKQL